MQINLPKTESWNTVIEVEYWIHKCMISKHLKSPMSLLALHNCKIQTDKQIWLLRSSHRQEILFQTLPRQLSGRAWARHSRQLFWWMMMFNRGRVIINATLTASIIQDSKLRQLKRQLQFSLLMMGFHKHVSVSCKLKTAAWGFKLSKAHCVRLSQYTLMFILLTNSWYKLMRSKWKELQQGKRLI